MHKTDPPINSLEMCTPLKKTCQITRGYYYHPRIAPFLLSPHFYPYDNNHWDIICNEIFATISQPPWNYNSTICNTPLHMSQIYTSLTPLMITIISPRHATIITVTTHKNYKLTISSTILSTMGAKSSITSTCFGYKYAVLLNRSVRAWSSKSTPQISWYSFVVIVAGSTVDWSLVRIVVGVEVERPNCGANAPNAEHDETV